MLSSRRLIIATATAALLALAAERTDAQISLTHAQPAAITSTGQTRVYLHGDKFAAPLRVWTSAPVNINVVEVTPTRVALDVAPRGDAPVLGGFNLVVATPDAISAPLLVLVDDLPSIIEAGDNHAPATAQSIGTSLAIDASSDGKLLDYFRFHADKDQAITFEILASSLGSACDPVVRILSEDGRVVRNIDDDAISPESRFRHSFSQAGNYLLEVHDNRFTAGGRYRVRLGNFPLVRFAYPPVVQRGQSASLTMVGPDRGMLANTEVVAPTDGLTAWLPVPARFQQGGTPATAIVRLSDQLQFQESEPNNSTEQANSIGSARGINGLLEQPGDHDFFKLTGVKDQTWRIAALTRSFGSSTMLKMTLRNAAGEVVGKTAVTDSDEWQFDVKLAADGDYILEVEDLLGRGGPDHGYHIQAGIAEPFTLALKPDPKTRVSFALQPNSGAAALDLLINRVWNNGPIEVRLEPQLPGLTIVNPVIPADAKEAKLFVLTAEGFNPQLIDEVRVVGKAMQPPEGSAVAGTQALLVQRAPHVPFPVPWQDGAIAMFGVTDQPAFFEVTAPSDPVALPRPQADGSVSLTIKRVQAEFKEPVFLVKSEVPANWSATHALDKDLLTLAIKHPTDATAETATLKFWWYGQWNERGQVFVSTVNFKLFDPMKVAVAPLAAVKPGEMTKAIIEITRQGGEPQPVTIKLANLPAGVTAPESIVIPAAESKIEVALTIAADAAVGKASGIVVNAATKLGEQEITSSSPPLELEIQPPSA